MPNDELINSLTTPSTPETPAPTTAPEAKPANPEEEFLNRDHTMVVNGKVVTRKMSEWLNEANKAVAFNVDTLQSRAAHGERVVQALKLTRLQPTDEGFDIEKVEAARAYLLKAAGASDAEIRGFNEQYREALRLSQGAVDDDDDDQESYVESQQTNRPSRPDPEVEKSARFRQELATRMFNESLEARLTSNPDLATELSKFKPDKVPQIRELVRSELRKAAFDYMEGRRHNGEEFSLAWIDEAMNHGTKETLDRLRVILGALNPVQGGSPGTTSMFGFDLSDKNKKQPAQAPKATDPSADMSGYFKDVLLERATEAVKARTSNGKFVV